MLKCKHYVAMLTAAGTLTASSYALAAVVSTVGVQNNNPYYMMLSPGSPDASSAGCKDKCYPTLNPGPGGGSQWTEIYSNSGWIALDYDFCERVAYDAKGTASCDGYLGHVSISVDTKQTQIKGTDGGSVTLSPYKAGTPFSVTFTPNVLPPAAFPKPSSYTQVPLRGVNLAGGEFNVFTLPKASDAVYFVEKGMNTIRLPFLWENFQPDLSKPIDFTQGNPKQYVALVNSLTDAGLTVIVDMHNFMRYKDGLIGVGNSPATNQRFADAWVSIAQQFRGNSKVILDLMNEPTATGLSTQSILNSYNVALPAIRNAGFNGLILLEGNNWSSLAFWVRGDGDLANGDVLIPKNINDPAKNYAVSPHLYFNSSIGGGNGASECVDPKQMLDIERFNDFVNWMKTNKVPVFIGETGIIATSKCTEDLKLFLNNIQQNPYQQGQGGFIGWAGWVGGNMGGTPNYLGTTNGKEAMQMTQGFSLYLTPAQ